MTRPRDITQAECDICMSDPRRLSRMERDAWDAHYQWHYRGDRRRAQYRASKAKRRTLADAYGALHSLGCEMPRRCTCTPIPVYRGVRDDNAA